MMKKLTVLMMLIGAFIGLSSSAYAGNRTISGKIIDADEEYEMPGVLVVIKGTAHGVATDLDGNFILDNVPDDAVLVISMVGYETIEIKAKDFKNGTKIKLKYNGIIITPDTYVCLDFTLLKAIKKEFDFA